MPDPVHATHQLADSHIWVHNFHPQTRVLQYSTVLQKVLYHFIVSTTKGYDGIHWRTMCYLYELFF